MAPNDWIRVRGIGRERFASYMAEFLETAGFAVERAETAEPSESHVRAHLTRTNPAIPTSGGELAFRVYPTSGGAAAEWELPTIVQAAERARMDRFARELLAHLERSVLTESHGTAKVTRIPGSHLPWESAPAIVPPAVSNAGGARGVSL
ncbi:MAG: hypothetical protein L3K15_03255 [Thermoplasmata archaeon]|nr:hypothetical protein [Thermoplasmata archaeon]